MTPTVAMKLYGFEWTNQYGLDETAAARRLEEQGVDWVVVQNRRDPIPGSGVEQLGPPPGYDDHRFRDHLRERGLRVFEATAVYFQPGEYWARPELRPIASDASVMRPFDWYVGLCPSDPAHVARRAEILSEVVDDLRPDGVFLNFIRFPGFWEAWTPRRTRAEIKEYCFCERCLRGFSQSTGNDLPVHDPVRAAAILQHELRAEWTSWKCALIADVVRRLRTAVCAVQPGTEVLINGVAMGRDDFGDAVREVLGQDLGLISREAEHTELMLYHQILARDPSPWIESLVGEMRPRIDGTLLACLQTSPTYLDPPHDGMGRRSDIPPQEFRAALRAIALV
ncbi:hypothetical protein, partial [Nonomuraea monospora]|uniref:hypothetical protein n=1 Tax=Nonomuraea monospora TaxID=568818 RepID=UPI0031D936E1